MIDKYPERSRKGVRRVNVGCPKRFKREFDPGSESTLAARLTHASRTRKGAILSKVAYG
jgi:hypothetical protein